MVLYFDWSIAYFLGNHVALFNALLKLLFCGKTFGFVCVYFLDEF